MSFLPTSFQASLRACEGLAGGLTAISFFAASWACAGRASMAVASMETATNGVFIMEIPQFEVAKAIVLGRNSVRKTRWQRSTLKVTCLAENQSGGRDRLSLRGDTPI